MGSSIIFASALAAAVASSPSSVSAPLQPTGPWNVEFAENMCLLTRPFGDGERKVTLGLKPGPASDSMRLILLAKAKIEDATFGVAQVSLDQMPAVSGGYVAAPVKDSGMQIVAIDLKKSELGALNHAKQILVQSKPITVGLEPSRMDEALRVLGTCEKDLLVSWGMDSAVVASVAEFPWINRSKGATSFFSTDDYPEDALRRDEQGTTGARVHVGTDGRVTDCKVIESSGSASIDSQTCSIIRARFRFEPARTSDGRTVASFTYQRIRWEMPSK